MLLGPSICFGQTPEHECVILLHGLARSKGSMTKMEKRLQAQGYYTVNKGYPSRHKTIEDLSEETIPDAVAICRNNSAAKIHFVTHSMGGILVRYYLKHHEIQGLGRVVMLSPPNNGSEVVDQFGDNILFQYINGPAGKQLGTDPSSLPGRLGKVEFDLGVITGDRSINFINSLIIPGTDDGKVSIPDARVEGMNDFLVVHATHPFIMKDNETIEKTIHFLKHGKFQDKE
jgi:hypothetical protein